MLKILFFSLLITFSGLHLSAQRRAQPVDGFAAEVDGRIITVGDVIERIRPALLQIVKRYSGPELVEKQTEVFEGGLEKLVEQSLMVAEFSKMGAELPSGTVRERKDSIRRERFDDNRDQLINALRQVGKTEQIWEDEIRDQLITQSMVQQFVRAQVHISPREIREAYEAKKSDLQHDIELRLRSIAFRPATEGEEQERLEKIQTVMKELSEGTGFAEVARSYSEGPKADQGGDEGWVNLSSLPEELQEALKDRQPGQLTPLIETPFQSFIFKTVDRRGGETKTLSQAQLAIERELESEKYQVIYEAWMKGLRAKFHVRYFKPDISAVTGDL